MGVCTFSEGGCAPGTARRTPSLVAGTVRGREEQAAGGCPRQHTQGRWAHSSGRRMTLSPCQPLPSHVLGAPGGGGRGPPRAHPHRACFPAAPPQQLSTREEGKGSSVFLFDGTEVVLILNLLVRWGSQECCRHPDLGPPEARQGVPRCEWGRCLAAQRPGRGGGRRRG